MNSRKLIALLFGFYLLPVNVSAIEINECEDEEGNRSFQKTCPPGSISVNKKNYKLPGTSADPGTFGAPDANTPAPVVLYVKPDCPVCERSRKFLSNNNVPVNVKNIADGGEIRNELITRTGINAGVPVLFVGDQMLRGFDNIRMASMLEDAGYPVSAGQAP